jgi:diguanylate cyclase (GGDEF)-like protein
MDGDQIKIGRTIFKFLSGSNVEAQYHDEIYRLTTTDGLTQVYNKRFLLKEMEREMSRSLRYDRELSLIMCDIDHFKPINDTYGHLAGDHILRQLAKRIREHIRRDDIVARYGGEEFALVLPEVDKHKAGQMAEKLRKIISDQPFIFDNITIPITLSMGISDLEEYKKVVPNSSESDVNPFAFIKLSDDRLYQAKQSGRNRIVIG